LSERSCGFDWEETEYFVGSDKKSNHPEYVKEIRYRDMTVVLVGTT
jgi:hypothetical protein